MTTGPRILIVDDNEEFCQNIADILEMKDFVVTTAYDGFKALELVRSGDFDIVLMDVKMPVMDGVKTFKEMKALKPALPVIIMSAYAVEELIRDALREGAFGAMSKPLDFDRLLEIIENTRAVGSLIMVVDDDKALCENMKDILVDRGYQVLVANDGEMALRQVSEQAVEVIILDMNLPPLNGLETYLAIKHIRPHAVVILLTGFRMEMSRIVNQALEHSVYTCLEKPVDIDRLLYLLERIKSQKVQGCLEKPGTITS